MWIRNDTESKPTNEYADEGFEVEVIPAGAYRDMAEALRDVVDVAEHFGTSETHKAACYGALLGTLPKIRAALRKAGIES